MKRHFGIVPCISQLSIISLLTLYFGGDYHRSQWEVYHWPQWGQCFTPIQLGNLTVFRKKLRHSTPLRAKPLVL